MSKLYKWKKINYKTFLPKHAPVVVYIVAKANMYDRHGMSIPAGAPPSRSRLGSNHHMGTQQTNSGYVPTEPHHHHH